MYIHVCHILNLDLFDIYRELLMNRITVQWEYDKYIYISKCDLQADKCNSEKENSFLTLKILPRNIHGHSCRSTQYVLGNILEKYI